jgi:hypothetical protein
MRKFLPFLKVIVSSWLESIWFSGNLVLTLLPVITVSSRTVISLVGNPNDTRKPVPPLQRRLSSDHSEPHLLLSMRLGHKPG